MSLLESQTDSIRFFVTGEPKGQPRARAFARGGIVRMYDPGTAEGWKGQIAEASKEFKGANIDMPIHMSLDFLLPRPKSHYRTGKNAHQMRPDAPQWFTGKPDVDNYAKAVMDALTQIGVWRDDALVVSLSVTKSYKGPDSQSGCSVLIRQAHNP